MRRMDRRQGDAKRRVAQRKQVEETPLDAPRLPQAIRLQDEGNRPELLYSPED